LQRQKPRRAVAGLEQRVILARLHAMLGEILSEQEIARRIEPRHAHFLALELFDVANGCAGHEPKQRPFIAGKKHAQIGPTQIGAHRRRRNTGERHLAGHERQIGQGSGHLNKIDIQTFFFVVAPFFGREKGNLGNVVAGYGDADIPGLAGGGDG
jgi:hypothetical protein